MDHTLFIFLLLCLGFLLVVCFAGVYFFLKGVRRVGRAWRGGR